MGAPQTLNLRGFRVRVDWVSGSEDLVSGYLAELRMPGFGFRAAGFVGFVAGFRIWGVVVFVFAGLGFADLVLLDFWVQKALFDWMGPNGN